MILYSDKKKKSGTSSTPLGQEKQGEFGAQAAEQKGSGAHAGLGTKVYAEFSLLFFMHEKSYSYSI